MSMRLGELLVLKGIITEPQLSAALEAQKARGGHLGTCLIELGYVDDRCLGKTLAEAVGVDYAQRELLLNVAGYVISVVPKGIVEKHQVIPFGLQNTSLHVAMVDPTDVVGVDELSAASGREVKSYISPEIVILHAMQQYYEIPSKPRYAALADSLAWGVSRSGKRKTADPERREIRRAAQSGGAPASGKTHRAERAISVKWAKRASKDGATPRTAWCNLYDLSLSNDYFNELEGVYVVWHRGRNPVLCVGQGVIREQLERIQRNQGIQAEHGECGLFVTWAPIPPDQRDGVEGYLARILDPVICTAALTAAPIEVNLPQ
jgi:hypothetical protein